MATGEQIPILSQFLQLRVFRKHGCHVVTDGFPVLIRQFKLHVVKKPNFGRYLMHIGLIPHYFLIVREQGSEIRKLNAIAIVLVIVFPRDEDARIGAPAMGLTADAGILIAQ